MTEQITDAEYADEPAEDNRVPLRGKWMMDEAASLAEAATKLRARADELDQMAKDGWTLDGSVDDDWGFMVPPEGHTP